MLGRGTISSPSEGCAWEFPAPKAPAKFFPKARRKFPVCFLGLVDSTYVALQEHTSTSPHPPKHYSATRAAPHAGIGPPSKRAKNAD